MKIAPVVQNVRKTICSPRFAEFTENTMYAVTIETLLKMTGRPTFIYFDKEADSKEKKRYSAVKEFLYQGTCLGLYWGIVPTVKKYLYKGFSYVISKNSTKNKAEIGIFNAEKHKVEDAKKAYKESGSLFERMFNKKAAVKTAKKTFENTYRAFQSKIKDESYTKLRLGKGVTEFSAIIGSILTLAILAPQISHPIIHPMMKFLGFDSSNKKINTL
jgi:hypothetical protein